jgi:hypothetical protein
MPYSFSFWGVVSPACCPADIIGQIEHQFGEVVRVSDDWKACPKGWALHRGEEEATILLADGRIGGRAYRWDREVA